MTDFIRESSRDWTVHQCSTDRQAEDLRIGSLGFIRGSDRRIRPMFIKKYQAQTCWPTSLVLSVTKIRKGVDLLQKELS